MKSETQQQKVVEYNKVFDEKDYKKRTKKAQHATDNFYDLITKFYERGWGESFHFAPRYKGEDFKASILRHEYLLGAKLGLTEKDSVLDVGCGIMGPARNLARISGTHITGLTINQYQVDRANQLNSQSSVSHLLKAVQGDFMAIPFPDNHFDKAYAIEALCHAPDMTGVYKQILKKLKPGGWAAFYQWGMTGKYDQENPEYVKIKEQIEYGNSITKIKTLKEIDEAVKASGFIIEETTDLVQADYGNDVPWYATLQSGWSLKQIRQTKGSRMVMKQVFKTLEALKVVKKGVVKTQKILLIAADALVEGGKLEIFTPMYLVVVRKKK